MNRKHLCALTLAIVLACASGAMACTAFVVGKNASATGNAFFARTGDIRSFFAFYEKNYPAGTYRKGQTLANPYLDNNWSYTFTHDSYAFHAVPFMPCDFGISNTAPDTWEENGMNEYGLTISATNTAYLRDEAKVKGNGYAKYGIEESFVPKLVLAECRTPREAVEFMGRLVENEGVGDGIGFIFYVGNQDEVWLFETVGHKRWVASRVPDDKFAVIANDMVTDYVDLSDAENFLGTPDVEQFAIDNGFAVYGGPAAGVHSDDVNIAASYANLNSSYNTFRRWRGYSLFAPSRVTEPLSADSALKAYNLFIEPDAKISPTDVMAATRNRYEGTSYDISTLRRADLYTEPSESAGQTPGQEQRENEKTTGLEWYPRPIGFNTTAHAHVTEIVQGMPAELAPRMYFCASTPETSVFLPTYANGAGWHPYASTMLNSLHYRPDSYHFIFQDIGLRARENRAMYTLPIKAYWQSYERALAAKQDSVHNEMARLYRADRSSSMTRMKEYMQNTQQRAMNRAGLIRRELIRHTASRPGTLFTVPSDSVPYANAELLADDTNGGADMVEAAMNLTPGSAKRALFSSREQTTVLNSGLAPALPGLKALSTDGVKLHVNLADGANFARVKATFELMGADYAALGGTVDGVKSNFVLMSDGGEMVGPNGLVTLQEALNSGMALLIGDKESATVALDFYLWDGAGEDAGVDDVLVLADGAADGKLDGPTLYAYSAGSGSGSSGGTSSGGSGGGCEAFGLGLAGLAFAALRRRK